MNTYNIDNLHFSETDSCKINTILVLHGWGQNIDIMKIRNEALLAKYNFLYLDLPGFGKSVMANSPLDTFDYVDIIYKFLIAKNYQIQLIIGHSFGGKIAIGLANLLKVKGLFLISPSIIKPRRNIDYYFKIYKYKLLKKLAIFFKINLKKYGSADYQQLSETMKKTFVRVVNSYYTKKDLQKIDCPVILFWGGLDKVTTLKYGYKIKKYLNDCELIVADRCDHFSFMQNKYLYYAVLANFISGVGL